jgi:hypothetical protein
MRATVEDGFTGPLAGLRDALRMVGNVSTGRAMEKDWKAVESRVTSVADRLRMGVAPVLRGIGITSLGVGAAVTGAVLGLRNFANSTRDLKIFSHEVGMSVQKLREVKALGEFFGMSWDSAKGSLKSFSDTMDQMHRRVGAYGQLKYMNLSDLAESLANSTDMTKAFDQTLAAIKRIANPARQRDVARILMGSEEWAPIAREMTPKLLNQIHQFLKVLPQGSQEASERFALDMFKIQTRLENLRTQGFAPLLPEVDRLLQLLGGGGSAGEGFVVSEAKKLAKALQDIDDVIEKLEKGDWRGALGRMFGGGFSVEPGTPLDYLVHGKSAYQRGKLNADEQRLRDIDAELPGSQSKTHTMVLQTERRRLIQEMEELRKAIDDANKSGALLQKQSYSGVGSGGARVMNASLGGGSSSGGMRGSGGPVLPRYTPPVGSGGTGPFVGPSGNLPDVPGGVIDRSRFARELQQNPSLREKVMGISAGENLNPKANISVIESMMNRAAMAGTSLAAQARLYNGEGGYYAGYNPGALRNPRTRAMIEKNLAAALAGSNVSNYATDNSSGGLAANEKATGKFNLQSEYGGESFFSPGWAGGRGGPRSRSAYEAWRRGIGGAGKTAGETMLDHLIPLPRPAPAEIRGNASIVVDFRNIPSGAMIKSDFDGMFRQVKIRRGRPMQSVWDHDSE